MSVFESYAIDDFFVVQHIGVGMTPPHSSVSFFQSVPFDAPRASEGTDLPVYIMPGNCRSQG